MSSLGSRSVLPRTTPPPAALQRLTAADIGVPCNCWAGTTSISASLVAGAGANSSANTPDLQCSPDQVVTATVGAWPASAGDNRRIVLCARMDGANAASVASSIVGYLFYIYTDNPVGTGTCTYGLGADSIFNPIAAELTHQTNPAPGDTLELRAIGTSIVAKKNGSTLFTATDSTYTMGHYAGGEDFNAVTITGLQAVTSC